MLHIVIYTAFEKLRNRPAQNVLALSVALVSAQFLFVTSLSYTESHSICK